MTAAGWPTVGELEGRVLVVLTAEVEAYRDRPVADAAAFTAAEPTVEALASDAFVFFNQRSDRISGSVVRAVEARSGVLRAWGAPTGDALEANYVAID